jgi:uncharacterized protein (TIGR02246 family)
VQPHDRWSWWMRMTCAIVVLSGVGFLATRIAWPVSADENKKGESTPAKHSPDEKALRASAAAYVKAFNAGDASKVSTFWMADGDYVDASGTRFRGRKAIAQELARFFAENPGVKLRIEPQEYRWLAPGLAIENGVARLESPSGEPLSDCRYTVTHVKTDGKWLMAIVRELPNQAASSDEHLRDLAWLVGTWTARAGKRNIEQSCDWGLNKNFLIRKYVVKDGNTILRKGFQVVGWDANSEQIHAWMFDSDGGFGEESWSPDGERWVQEATGVQRDGGKTEAVNVLTRINNNTYTWQSVRRSADGVDLPDTEVITLHRAGGGKQAKGQ